MHSPFSPYKRHVIVVLREETFANVVAEGGAACTNCTSSASGASTPWPTVATPPVVMTEVPFYPAILAAQNWPANFPLQTL